MIIPRKGYVRERAAMLKAMVNITTRPDPALLGRTESGVQRALAAGPE